MVKVRRIVANLQAEDPQEIAAFYRALFDLDLVMDLSWIVTLEGAQDGAAVQMSVLRHGGSGAPAPHLSIEVDDVDAVHGRAVARGVEIVYPLTDEPWGIRRFFLRDPGGRLVNVAAHL